MGFGVGSWGEVADLFDPSVSSHRDTSNLRIFSGFNIMHKHSCTKSLFTYMHIKGMDSWDDGELLVMIDSIVGDF